MESKELASKLFSDVTKFNKIEYEGVLRDTAFKILTSKNWCREKVFLNSLFDINVKNKLNLPVSKIKMRTKAWNDAMHHRCEALADNDNNIY